MYAHLLSHTLERPFNFNYGLSLFSQLLPLPLPIPMPCQINANHHQNNNLQNTNNTRTEEMQILKERRFLSDHLEPLFITSGTGNAEKQHIFVTFIRVLCLTSAKSAANGLLKRIFVQLSDLSENVCASLIRCLLDYAIELFNELTIVEGEGRTDRDEDEENNEEVDEQVLADREVEEAINNRESSSLLGSFIEKNSELSRLHQQHLSANNSNTTNINQMDMDDVFNDANESGDMDSIYDTNLMDDNSL